MLSIVFCFVFGILLILNIHPIGEGMWFWYAMFIRHGQKLYSGMHLPLQPFFVLLTAWTQDLFGISWLGSKILALIQLLVFCYTLFSTVRFIPWLDAQKAVLLAAAFLLSLSALYARFDDYHITVQCFELLCILLLLHSGKTEKSFFPGATGCGLGLLCGLALATRLNDGAALLAATAMTLPYFIRRHRSAVYLCFVIFTMLTFRGVLWFTHDSIHVWYSSTVVAAAAIKGGTEHILSAPLTFPRMLLRLLLEKPNAANLLTDGFVVGSCTYLLSRSEEYKPQAKLRIITASITLIFGVPFLIWQSRTAHPEEALTTLGLLLLLSLSFWLFAKIFLSLFWNSAKGPDARQMLLAIPALQVLSGAMTSGISILEAFPQIAVLLILLPIVMFSAFRLRSTRTAFVCMATLLVLCATSYKCLVPYSWHHFKDRALFADRVWYQHPLYGPIYVERDQLNFVESICADIAKDGTPADLLSLENPYPNYFCNIPPWHGYVQTWYDTTSAQTIDTLDAQLAVAPPKWIVYQRALDSMSLHEEAFNHGRPLPHRKLDRLIMDHISDGQWKVVQRQWFEGADWIVIRTHA